MRMLLYTLNATELNKLRQDSERGRAYGSCTGDVNNLVTGRFMGFWVMKQGWQVNNC